MSDHFPSGPAESGEALHADDAPSSDEIEAPTRVVVVPSAIGMVSLLGPHDQLLATMERNLPGLDIFVRGNEIHLAGPEIELDLAESLLDELLVIVGAGQPLNRDAVERSIRMLRDRVRERPADVLMANIVSSRGRTIRPKTLNQKRYVDAIDEHTVVFGIGPAGTGKTYLAMAKAVAALQSKQVNRIILTRPAVEAGERLGFLPGTLNDKIDPYLRPLYDALHDMIDPESIPRLMAAGTIEVAPLAYMRGRAQPLDSMVLTPTGFRPIGSLRVGDLVVGSNGVPTVVLGVYPQGVKETYRVTAQDGSSTLCCGEHLWTVRTPEDGRRGRWRTLQTQDMRPRLRRGAIRRYELPVVGPVEFEPRDVPIDAYAMGLLLGGGCLTTATTATFTTADPELAESVQSALEHVGDLRLQRKGSHDYVIRHMAGGRGGVIVTNPVTQMLRDLGLAGTRSSTKFVPPVYLFNSRAVRLAVLQGMLDTDGGSLVRRARTTRVQWTTTSTRLRDDMVFLVRSLGGVASTRTRLAEGRTPGRAQGRPVPYRHDAYVLDIRLPADVAPFRLERKARQYAATGGGRPMRHIESIEPAGRRECVCIQVAAQDSLYVTDDFLVTHNTLNDAFIILDEAQNTSPEQMKMFLTRLGFGSKIVVTGDVTQVDLPTGTQSGLRVVRDILTDIDDIHFAELSAVDVVRHRLVGDIVEAYGRWDARQPHPGRRTVSPPPSRRRDDDDREHRGQ